MGHKIDLGRLANPALLRVVRDRVEYGFMFSYGDHEQYREKTHREYKEYSQYDYSESSYSGW